MLRGLCGMQAIQQARFLGSAGQLFLSLAAFVTRHQTIRPKKYKKCDQLQLSVYF